MNSVQYEELCRFFLVQKTGLPIEKITSILIPNPKRGDLPQYKHQIDLYWETGDDVCLYLNIANAKWRGSDKVEQGEVLLLQQVRQQVAAHKAVMITNSEFTSGAEAVAKDEGIALHIVAPILGSLALHDRDRSVIQCQFREVDVSQPIFEHRVVHKAFDLATTASPSGAATSPAPSSYATKVITSSVNKAFGGYSHKGGSGGSGQVGGLGGGPVTKGGGGGGFRTK